jgi:hypothetical protein
VPAGRRDGRDLVIEMRIHGAPPPHPSISDLLGCD